MGKVQEKQMKNIEAINNAIVKKIIKKKKIPEFFAGDTIKVGVSIGDYILSGGEIGAFVLIDAIVRLIPGVIGNAKSLPEETFEKNLLECPQYTKPQKWEKKEVPEILLTGDHDKIKDWRLSQSRDITRRRRPDFWGKYKKNK